MRSIVLFLAILGLLAIPARAQDAAPYEGDLLRLSEMLGALHYLRTLCEAEDAGIWRDRMQALMEAEECTTERCERMAGAFNAGYRSFARTYRSCTPSAEAASRRFLNEGSKLAESITSRHAN